jgi:hypothetical protein
VAAWLRLALDAGVSFSSGMRNAPKSLITVTSVAEVDITRALILEPSCKMRSDVVSSAFAAMSVTRTPKSKRSALMWVVFVESFEA